VRDMGICEVLSAPRSPWQRAYVERVIGSIRRECLDHVIVFQESSLRRSERRWRFAQAAVRLTPNKSVRGLTGPERFGLMEVKRQPAVAGPIRFADEERGSQGLHLLAVALSSIAEGHPHAQGHKS
jgi:hypothetical protein